MHQPHEVVLAGAEAHFHQRLKPPELEHPMRGHHEARCIRALGKYANLSYSRAEQDCFVVADGNHEWPEPVRMMALLSPGICPQLVRLPGKELFVFRAIAPISQAGLSLSEIHMPIGEDFALRAEVYGRPSPFFRLSLKRFSELYAGYVDTSIWLNLNGGVSIASSCQEGFPNLWCKFVEGDLYAHYERKQGGLEAETQVVLKPDEQMRLECMQAQNGITWREGCRRVLVSNLDGRCASLFYQVNDQHSVGLRITAEQMAFSMYDVVRRAIWSPASLTSMINSIK